MAQQGLHGLKDLHKALKKLDGKVAGSIARKSIGKAGREVRDAAKGRVPPGHDTLRASIRTRTKRLGRTGFATSIGPMRVMGRDRDTKKSFVKHDAWYAHIIERGSRPHLIPYKGARLTRKKTLRNMKMKINGNWVTGPVRHPGTRPRPFMRPAWHATKDRLPGVMGRELWRLINKEQKK